MSDLKCARAGAPISERARARFARYGRELPAVVGPWSKDDGPGQWVCVACGHFTENAIDAHGHAGGSKERRVKSEPGGIRGCASPLFAWRDSAGALVQGPQDATKCEPLPVPDGTPAPARLMRRFVL